jgi:hypothetical protein
LTRLRTFEGRELEQLLDHVQVTCGPDATIVSANRVRKGGVKGFFATEVFELKVEDPSDAPAPGGGDDAADEVDPAERELRFAAALAAAVDGFEDLHESDTDSADVASPAPASVLAASVPAEPVFALASAAPVAEMRVPSAPASNPAVAPAPRPAVAAPAAVVGSTPSAATVVEGPDPAVATRSPEPARPAPSRPTPARPAAARRAPARSVPAESAPSRPIQVLDSVPTLWELLDRYASLPALPERPPAGVTVVVGAPEHVLVAATGVAARSGLDPAQVLLASAQPSPAISPWHWVGSPGEAAERTAAHMGRAGGRNRPRIVLAVACEGDEDSRRWVDEVIGAVGAVRRHVAVAARADEAEAGALVARFDADALDLVGLDDAVAPDGLCRLGLPVTTLEGRPASPALWAALAVERSCRVPA